MGLSQRLFEGFGSQLEGFVDFQGRSEDFRRFKVMTLIAGPEGFRRLTKILKATQKDC